VSWCATPDDGVVLVPQRGAGELRALAAVGEILASLGLRLHPDKDEGGRPGVRAEMAWIFWVVIFRCGACSGRLWEQKRIVRYYLPPLAQPKRPLARVAGQGP